jgi:hypothetical protein
MYLMVAGVSVLLVEADFLRIGSGRIQSGSASDDGKAQKALPVDAGVVQSTPNATELGFEAIMPVIPIFSSPSGLKLAFIAGTLPQID